jgi:cation transport ATPase
MAGLIGPTIVALTLSEAMNLRIWAHNMAPVVYLNGALLFVAGLAIIRAHNRWTFGWPVMVTIAGWMALLGGLYRMFAPAAPQAGENSFTYAALVGLFLFGAVLTFKAYV